MPRDQATRLSAKVLGSVALVLLVTLPACRITLGPSSVSRPETVYEPDFAGEVSDGQCDHDTDTCVLTIDGETFEVGPNARSLAGGDSPGGSNTVLLFGAEDDFSWFLNGRIASTTELAGCAVLRTSDAWDDGDSIVFAFRSDSDNDAVVGIRLPKSDDWAQDLDLEPDGRYPYSYSWWCLDPQGHVAAVYQGAGA